VLASLFWQLLRPLWPYRLAAASGVPAHLHVTVQLLLVGAADMSCSRHHDAAAVSHTFHLLPVLQSRLTQGLVALP
jgi:hypothetical protein